MKIVTKKLQAIHGESYLQNNIKGKKILEKMNGFKNEIDSINVMLNLEKKLMKYANEMDSLTKIIDEKYIIPYPDGISDSEIYEEYTLIFNEKNKLNEWHK